MTDAVTHLIGSKPQQLSFRDQTIVIRKSRNALFISSDVRSMRADSEHVLFREARNYGFGLTARSVPPHVDSDKLRNELHS